MHDGKNLQLRFWKSWVIVWVSLSTTLHTFREEILLIPYLIFRGKQTEMLKQPNPNRIIYGPHTFLLEDICCSDLIFDDIGVSAQNKRTVVSGLRCAAQNSSNI